MIALLLAAQLTKVVFTHRDCTPHTRSYFEMRHSGKITKIKPTIDPLGTCSVRLPKAYKNRDLISVRVCWYSGQCSAWTSGR
jgi:hypothetical protein